MTNIIIKSLSGIITFYFLTFFIQNIYKHQIDVSKNVSLFSAIITSIIILFLEYIKNKDTYVNRLDRLNYTLFRQNRTLETINEKKMRILHKNITQEYYTRIM